MATAERHTTDNKELARRDVEEVWNAGNLDLIEEYVADEFVLHDPTMPDEFRGPDGYRAYVEMYRTAFPDATITIEELVGEGDTVAVRWTGRGTHEGDLFGIDPTHESVEVAGTSFARIEDGRFVEEWQCYDSFGMMRQLGVVPEE